LWLRARRSIDGARQSLSKGLPVTIEELKKVERYLRRLFGNEQLTVKARPRKDDSAEVFVSGEFIGVIYRDDEDQELSYNFTMAILAYDLDE
jgi:hypothetical protein